MRKKRSWNKKTLALVLSAVMTFCAADITAFASETEMQKAAEKTEAEENFAITEEETVVSASSSESVMENESQETDKTKESEVMESNEQLSAADNIDSGIVNDISWMLDNDGTLTITGSGDYYLSDGLGNNMPWSAPWYAHREKITSAKVNVTGMTDISYMFQDCAKLEEVDFSGFSADNLRGASAVFEGCVSLTELDLSTLETSKVINMNAMFRNCTNLKSINISSFRTDSVKNMSFMFDGCNALTSLDLGVFCTENVTEMICMFSDCSSLASLDLSAFRTENVTDMQAMFSGCSALAQLDLSGFDVKNVTNMERMFEDCTTLSSLELSHFVTQSVTSLYGMFSGCSALTQLRLNQFCTDNVVSMSSMFRDCASLTELDLSSFDTSSVQNMSQMFAGCKNLSKLTIDSFQTENVTTMERMFLECANLTKLDLSNFRTGNVTTMDLMFNDCKSLERLNVNSFDTRRVETVMEMFTGCTSLTELNLSNFDLSGLTDEMSVFGDCDALKKIYAPCKLSVGIPLTLFVDFEEEQDNRWYQGEDVITALPKNLEYSVLLTRGQKTSVTETYITATKRKTVYVCGETLSLEDLTVQYYGTDAKVIPVTNYTTNKDEIDMSIAGIKELRISYQDGEKDLTTVVRLTVQNLSEENIAEGISENISWTIDRKGKLTVTGNGDYERNGSRAPWYDYRARIKSAEIKVTDITDTSWMFADCINLTAMNVSGFDTRNVIDMSYMFYNCSSLTELNLNNFVTGNVENMSSMFEQCKNLAELDLSSFDTRKVTDISGMFAYCNRLISLNMSSFDLTAVGTGGDVRIQPFLSCEKLSYLHIPKNCFIDVQLPRCEDGDCWYDENGMEYTAVPTLNHSVNLHKKTDVQNDKTKWTITYDLGGYGTPIASVTVNNGERLTAPTTPIAVGYTFGGWYKEDSCLNAWDFDEDTVTNDTVLFAKWTKNMMSLDTDIDDSPYTQNERKDLSVVGGAIDAVKPGTYDGNAYEPTVKVTVMENGKKKLLTEGADYRVLYENNINAETDGKVTVKGNGIYKGALTASLVVTPKSIKKLKIITGSMIVGDQSVPSVFVYDGAKQLKKGTDYSLEYDKNLTAQPTSASKVTIKGMNNYTGSVTVKLAVYEGDASQTINPSNVTLSVQKAPYTGKAIKTVEPQVKIGTKTLQVNKDYKVQYQNNKNAGTAYVIVTGKGTYKGKVVKTFEIMPVESDFTIKEIPAKTYNGKLQKPSVTVTAAGRKLSKNKDFTVSYVQNLHTGIKTAQVLVTGKGNYAGIQKKAVFTIQPQKIKKVSVKGTQGNLTLTYSKRVLKEGTDYTLQYGETLKDKITVVITGKGDFEGTVTKKVKAQKANGGQDKDPDESEDKESETSGDKESTSDEDDKKPDKPVEDEKEQEIKEKLSSVYRELGLDSISRIEKIEKIYDYVVNNVTYDSTSETRYTLYGALIEGKAVCNGYALLMERMLTDNDIPAQYISGIGLSCSDGPARHAWNIVEYNGFYYNVDATWDCTNGHTREWFMKSQADFEDHVRDAQYDTEAFLASYPMAKYSYGEDGSLPRYENLNYTFNVVGGGTVSTSTEADKKTTVLIFGKTTCSNTKSFLQSLKEKEFTKREDIKLIFADGETKETEDMVAAFQKEYGIEGMYFCYDNGVESPTNRATFEYYNKNPKENFVLPVVVVIDAENTVRYIRSYPVSVSSVEQCLERLDQE